MCLCVYTYKHTHTQHIYIYIYTHKYIHLYLPCYQIKTMSSHSNTLFPHPTPHTHRHPSNLKCLRSRKYSLNEVTGSLLGESLLPATGKICKTERGREKGRERGKKVAKGGKKEGSELELCAPGERQRRVNRGHTKVACLPARPPASLPLRGKAKRQASERGELRGARGAQRRLRAPPALPRRAQPRGTHLSGSCVRS